MSSDLRFLLSLSITIPVIAGILRLNKIPPSYYPVIAIVLLGVVNETLVYKLPRTSSPVLNNIYLLSEFLLWCVQFRNWKNILTTKHIFYSLLIVSVLVWIVDELIFYKIINYKSLLFIFFPFCLVLLATQQLGFIVANGKTNILRNAISLFCIAIILCFSYRILAEIFYHYAPTSDMKTSIFSIQVYVNVIFNILLGIAIFIIPKKGIYR